MCEPATIGYGLLALAGGAAAAKIMAPKAPDAAIAPTAPATPPAPTAQGAKAPDVKAMRTANSGAGTGVNAGPASTLLTGTSGVDPATLALAKPKLLGTNTLLGS